MHRSPGTPSVMRPRRSDVVCLILLGPPSGPAAGGAHWRCPRADWRQPQSGRRAYPPPLCRVQLRRRTRGAMARCRQQRLPRRRAVTNPRSHLEERSVFQRTDIGSQGHSYPGIERLAEPRSMHVQGGLGAASRPGTRCDPRPSPNAGLAAHPPAPMQECRRE